MKQIPILILAILLSVGTPVTALAGTYYLQTRLNSAVMHEEQLADICWIVLLCLFSFFARSRTKSRLRVHLITAAFLLLVLAAFHSHSLWSFSSKVPSAFENAPITRIMNVPTIPIGRELNERVTSVAFDPGARLWLSG